MREGRSPAQRGKKGQSNQRWMVGGTLCFIVNQWGLLCAWACATANVAEAHLHPLLAQCVGRMLVLTDTGLHAQTRDPTHLQVCPRRTWHTRMLVETVLSRLTTVIARQWAIACGLYFRARIAWTMVALNLLARWGLEIDDENMVRLSIAEFSL
jgi:hypothetical protein